MERSQLDPRLQRARRALGQARSIAAWQEGAALSLEQAVTEALREGQRKTARNKDAELTPREREVATHVVRGLSSREIAEVLVVTPRTVETHLERIYTKLQIHSRAQLAMWVGERPPSASLS